MVKVLLRDGVITPEEKEIVEYGLENLEGNLLGMLITMIIGMHFDYMLGSILLWVLLFPLRKNAGGFHAKTKGGCILFSSAILVVSMFCFVQVRCSEVGCICITLFFFLYIFFGAPVENKNKHLDPVEKKVYRKRTRIILVFEMLLYPAALFFEWKPVSTAITIAYFIVSVSLLTGELNMQIHRRRC